MNQNKHHLELLCDAGEMFALLAGQSTTKTVLQRCVLLVADHLRADVCSIYLLEDAGEELVLQATTGLNPDAVGQVRMNVNEGLVGKALREMSTILEDHASRNPDFKYFPGANEDRFECFLAIPILRGRQRIGVMVVQRPEPHPFSTDEAMVLRSIASQLAVVIDNARALLTIASPSPAPRPPKESTRKNAALPRLLTGRSASPGIAVGYALLAGKNPILELLRSDKVPDSPDLDAADLEAAIARTAGQLEAMEKEVSIKLPEAVTMIFDAHIMILNDKGFSGRMLDRVSTGTPAMTAVVETARHYIRLFSNSANDYLKERVADVEDIASRLIDNLLAPRNAEEPTREDRIYIALDLLPSEIVKLSVQHVSAIVMAGGGITSHAAILARSLQIPMIIVDDPALLSITNDIPLVVDARVGNLYLDPAQDVIERFRQQIRVEQALEPSTPLRNETRDSTPVSLMANINLLSEIDLALGQNAEGIGLYRSEFPFLVRNNFPSDTEQARVYSILFSKMAGKEVTVRTLDIGGDKMLSYLNITGEANPELGLRSIRLSFRYPDLFRDQIRAILLASAGVRLRIMFPLVGSLDDFQRARDTVIDCWKELRGQNRGPESLPALGMMIELPSIVEIIDALVREADFFSIGTNDFIQYMLAADRTNKQVAEFYQPGHPSVLRALNRIVAGITAGGKDVAVCGEMAREPRFIPFLLGIGIRKLSVDPQFLSEVRQTLADWTVTDAEAYAKKLLEEPTIRGIARIMTP